MTRAPFVIASLVGATGLATATHLAVAAEPFAASSAAVVAIGAVLFTLITVVGLTLVRGRWTRRLAIIVVVTELGVVAVGNLEPWAGLALIFGLTALSGLTGRWLDAWVRQRPSATGPDPLAVVLLLGLLGLVPAVGIAAPDGLDMAHGLLGAAGILLTWAYGKAQPWSLWTIRLVLPFLGVAAAMASPAAGAALLIAAAGGLTWLSWTTSARIAVQPLLDDPPGPRRSGTPRGAL